MKRIKLPCIAMLICILFQFTGYSQVTRTLTGTVFSAGTKQPLQGASIISKASGRATVSDDNGNFIFRNLVTSDTLIISTIGYVSREITVSGSDQSPFEVYLEQSVSRIEEVLVNTGYQSLPKERATGSFTQIDNDLFNRSVSSDLISRMEGITNGLSFELPVSRGAPSKHPDLRIRGLSTINGETAPLIVLDNFPYEGDLNNINPNDVESITVLKDAAAASIWGARAGNGVIVITTKRAASSDKATVNFNSNLTIAERPDLFYYRGFLPPNEAVELERKLYGMGLYSKNDWTAFTPAIEILFARDEGLIDDATANTRLDELKRYDIRREAAEYLYRQSVNQQYAMNINGGSESHQYYLSAGFDKNAANLVGNAYERITLNTKNDFHPLDRLRFSTSVTYMQSRSQNNGISMIDLSPAGMNDVYVYARLADEAGNALPIVRNNRYPYTDRAFETGLLDWHYRPLDELRIDDEVSGSREIRINIAGRYQLLRQLGAEARYQYQTIGNTSRNYHLQESYFARHEINRFTQTDGSRPVPLGGILDRGGTAFTAHYGRFQLDYSDSWAQKHQLDGLAGFELRQEQRKGTGNSRLYGYDDDILTFANNMDFVSSFPLRPRSSGRISYFNSPGNHTVDRFVSYYGNAAYSYDNRYILSASARWDASNIFGVDFNQKGVPLWSTGAAWIASNEPFFNVGWIDHSKLRLTYGSNGNAVRSLSSRPYIQYGSTDQVTGLPIGRLQNIGNPDLSWEQVNTVNMGLDFALLDSRISGSVEWYYKHGSNLIGEDFLDPTVGIYVTGKLGNTNLDSRRNYANMKTKGIDIELNTLNVDRQLKWQTNILFSHVGNEVSNYFIQSNPVITNFLASPLAIPVVEGVSKDQLYALPWHGLDENGSPLVLVDNELSTDYNAYFNGLDLDDLLKIGLSRPSYFGSVRNTFTWHSVSVGFNVLWKAGYRFRRGSISYSSLFGTSKLQHADYLGRWQTTGDELITNVPSMPQTADLRRDQAYLYSEILYESGDHIRLQDINISYQLPQHCFRNIGVTNVRLYAYARNLGIIWKQTGYDIDPDAKALYPQPLQMAFGLQIQL